MSSARRNEPIHSDEVNRIKRLAIVAMVSDDELMQQLVLKGGNAVDLIYGLGGRASIDIDFSIPGSIAGGLAALQKKIRGNIESVFRENGYSAFDIHVDERHAIIAREVADFWGGYQVRFKVIASEMQQRLGGGLEEMQRNAIPIGPRQERILQVDISSHEFCEGKKDQLVDGYLVYVYTPQMIVCEKLRAICQQMEEYKKIARSKSSVARARDFFDIYLVTERFHLSWTENEFRENLLAIFAAKRVPLHLIGKVHDTREFHRSDFEAVMATVKQPENLKEFDFYFEYVVARCEELKSLWVV